MATISLRRARTIIRKSLEVGREASMAPLSVVVLDAGGHVIAFERGEGAPPGRFEIALGKAYGCVMLGIGGTKLRERSRADDSFVMAAIGAYGGKLIPVPGGILVRDAKGAVMGAVGVTGDTSDNDLLAGVTAIEAVGLVAEG